MAAVRLAKPEDLDGIRRIYFAASSLSDARQDDYWRGLIAAGGVVVAGDEHHIVGFGTIDVQAAEQIKHIYVAPGSQNTGVGSAILRRLEEIARQHGLQALMLHASPAAIAFYTRAGYNPIDSHIRHDHEGVEMVKWL